MFKILSNLSSLSRFKIVPFENGGTPIITWGYPCCQNFTPPSPPGVNFSKFNPPPGVNFSKFHPPRGSTFQKFTPPGGGQILNNQNSTFSLSCCRNQRKLFIFNYFIIIFYNTFCTFKIIRFYTLIINLTQKYILILIYK